MAFTPLPNGIRVVWVFELFGKPVTITVHVTSPTAVNDAILAQARDAARDVWENGIAQTVASALIIRAIEVTDVSVPDGRQLRLVTFLTPQGLRTVESMSANVAVGLTLRSNRIGRSQRGRLFIPGIGEPDVSGNAIAGDAVPRFATLASVLNSSFETAGLQLVVASYFTNNAPRTTAQATPITAVVVRPTVRTQRRRLPR